MNYYLADTHFGHANIIRLCNRPFEDVYEMNEMIINNWNETVLPEDDVYIVGDFAHKNGNPVSILRRLNGNKHLIIGNHDLANLKDSDFRAEFTEIRDIQSVHDGDVKIILCHYPMAEWAGYYRDAWHFFGHIHNSDSTAQKIMKELPRCFNVGVDLINFTPKTLEQLMEMKNNQTSQI